MPDQILRLYAILFKLLLTSLTNPDVKTFETIDKTMYDFLWNKNPNIKNSCDIDIYRSRTEYDKPQCLYKCIKIYTDMKASSK